MQGKTGRLGLAVVGAVILAFGLSGCFFLTSTKWKPLAVKAGKSTTAVISMTPDLGPSKDKMIQAFMVGLPENANLSVGKRTWDTTGKFGGPLPLITDGPLRNALLNSDQCMIGNSHLSEIDAVEWTAVRTEGKVNDKDKEGVQAISRIKIGTPPGATGGNQLIHIVPGVWADDGDQVPVSDEVGCVGASLTTFTITD